MDGSPITLGAQVFDVAFGAGTVASVKAARFTVKYPSGAVSIYDMDGNSISFGRRTLFWANPLDGVRPPSHNPVVRNARALAHGTLDTQLDAVVIASCQP